MIGWIFITGISTKIRKMMNRLKRGKGSEGLRDKVMVFHLLIFQ